MEEMEEVVIKSLKKAEKIIFIFHKYGSSKEKFSVIGRSLSKKFDNAEIHIPDGPQACDEGDGHQWFPFISEDSSDWKNSYYEVAPILETYINNTLKQNNLKYEDVILTGFSQGAMVSLMLGLKLGVKAIVAFSGQLLDANINMQHNRIPKILLVHGKKDTIVPISEMYSAQNVLKKKNIKTEIFVSETAMHSIDIDMFKSGINFLKNL
ncbi:MAG: dienelactone hydrolase family protein [Alphaproteobacteria bacterium]|nr:dienelactone hydrolase family protein [Alphaproteobacteria bacterium]